MKIHYPDVLIVLLRFRGYDVKGSSKSKPNDIRRWLMGLKKAPTEPLPHRISRKVAVAEEDIIPYSFALIKEPTKLPGKRRFKGSAVGAMAVYLYAGSAEKFEDICKTVQEALKEAKDLKSLGFSEFELFAAKRWPYG